MDDEKTVKTNFNLDVHTFRLLQNEPFFAALSRRIHKVRTEAVPTAGVCLNKHTAQFEMFYNPKFMGGLSDNEKLGVLMHEFYHIIYEHVTGRLPEGGMNKLWNIATDLAINSHIADKLPEMACIPGRGPFESYPSGRASEWYYKKLQEDKENEEGPFKKPEGDQEGEEEKDKATGKVVPAMVLIQWTVMKVGAKLMPRLKPWLKKD